MANEANIQKTSQGIQSLIDLIREKGVNQGKEEGTRIVANAEQRTKWIISQAEEEAKRMKHEASQEANFIRQAGKEALNIAYRDIIVQLKNELTTLFTLQLRKLISTELNSPDTLRQLLMSAANKTNLPDQPLTILLPDRALSIDELRENPKLLEDDALLEMLSTVAKSLFSEGVSLSFDHQLHGGLNFILKEGEIEVEMSDKTLADLLLSHLQPRFRAILEGVVG